MRRIVNEQLDVAIAGLSSSTDSAESVHTARKSLKRIRTILRLIRPALGPELFDQQNQLFRDVGRLLSPLRDAHVQRDTLQQFNLPGSTIVLTLNQRLMGEEDELMSNLQTRKRAHRILVKTRREIDKWPLQKLNEVAVRKGLQRVYKNTQTAFRAAKKKASPENLHEWRKRTKDYLYVLELMTEFRSRKLAKARRRGKKLNEQLGMDHDFFFVFENLRQRPLSRPRSELHHIAQVVSDKRSRLEKRAFRIGKKLFEPDPREFAVQVTRKLKT